jgi:catalase (peroxidase I)
LNLRVLHQHSVKANPMGGEFSYAAEFKKLDQKALTKDLYALMTNSQDCWPADRADGPAQRRHLPRGRWPRRRQWGAHPTGAAEGLGRQPAGSTGQGSPSDRNDPEGVQRFAVRRQAGVVGRLDRSGRWKPGSEAADLFEGRDRGTGELKRTATRVDLICGSNAQLRAIAEVDGSEDGRQKFLHDFVAAWTKVMNLDRFDLL